MSARSLIKKKSLLVLCLLLLAGVTALLINTRSARTEEVVQAGQKKTSGASVVEVGTTTTKDEALHAAAKKAAAEAHALNCAHCAAESAEVTVEEKERVPPILQTQPHFDPIFKKIAQERVSYDRSDFDFLAGSQEGQTARFQLAGQEFSGEVALVREGERARSYAIDFPEGQLIVTFNTLDEFKAHFMFVGDSRVVEIAKDKQPREGEQRSGGSLLASEARVSDVLCAPTGAVYPLTSPQPVPMSGLLEKGAKEFPQPIGPIAAPSLTYQADSDHVFYLNFDGEVVTGDAWNRNSGISTINALPAPRANDVAWVTAVWKRVVEDFAPFDITVTTDRAVFNAAPSDRRLQAIITPTNVVAPGAGGVAFLNSYNTNFTDIVWVFNLTEYTCATTISHEAGHAFGLRHDGDDINEYYPGHNGSYEPGWAAIMGAAFIGLYDEVDQWSKGEYANANNQEDDIAIIANTANGFRFIQDDYADVFTGSGGLDVGALVDAGPNLVAGSGVISQSNDRDVFRFSAAFSGAVTMTVSPLDVASSDSARGSNTQGANLAVATRLLDSAGQEIAVGTDFGDVLLASRINASVEPGIYYLEVSGAGRGDDPSGGFSDYASMGRYAISGELPTQPMSVMGSPPVYDEKGNYVGPGKLNQPVILGDTSTSVRNGTDFGFSYPANKAIPHTFLLKNNGTTDLVNVAVSLTTGVDFRIASPPPATIPPGKSVLMVIEYDPLQAGVNGVDNDTVTINYDTPGDSIVYQYAINGVCTPSATKDNYEDNDVFDRATDLNQVKDTWLSDYKGRAFFLSYNDDFYTINVNNGELITIDVAYDASEGPINFTLYNSQNQILGSTSSEDGRMLFLVPQDYPARNKPFYIRANIERDPLRRSPYDLRWSSRASSGDDDFYEDNNSQDQAFDLTGAFSPRLSEYLGKGILNDEDWYKIEIPVDPFIRMLYVRAEFVHAEGDINIELIPAESTRSAYLKGLFGQDEDYEVITYSQSVATEDFAENFSPEGNTAIMGVEAGTYYIRVTGDYAGNEYDLVVEAKQDDAYEIVSEITNTENDEQGNSYDLGEAIVGRWLSEIDGIGTSSAYGLGATQENFNNGIDADWYQFSVPASMPIGELVIDYENFAGGTHVFRLYDSNLELIARSEDISDINIDDERRISAALPSGNTFFLYVIGTDNISGLSGYDFRVEVDETPPFIENPVDDNYEENDDINQAYNLTDHAGLWLSAKDGYGVQMDMDFYKIVVPQGAKQLSVMSTFDGGQGELYLTLYSSKGLRLTGTDPNANPDEPDDGGTDDDEEEEPAIINAKAIILDDPEPGVYSIIMTGDNRGNRYNLLWDYTRYEDNYEPNDSQATAYDLRGHEKQRLSKLNGLGVQANEDWYRITAGAGTAELRVRSTFTHDEGDIDLELYDAAGFLVARSVSVTNNEAITLPKPVAGDYFVRVFYGNAANEYDLWWGAFTQAELDEVKTDPYEVDNNREAATPLPSFTSLKDLEGLATQTDDDWWSIEISDNSLGFFLECTFTHSEGDIDIEVIDSLGAVVSRSNSQSDNESINFNAPLSKGTYFIRVYGANLGNSYDLYWADFRKDAFENNNSFGTAYDITEFRQIRLSTEERPTQGDDDWYRFTAEEANSILVVELTYTHSEGGIDFEIYDSNQNLLDSVTGNAEVKYLQYVLPSTGEFYIRVFGDDAYNEYDLFWNALPEDAYEENDVKDDAFDISAFEGVPLEGVVFDDDWFFIDPPYGVVSVELTLDFIHAYGDTDVRVYNQFGDLIAQAFDIVNGEVLSFEVNPFNEGVTYVEVFGYDGNYGNPYTLEWNSVTRDVHEDNDTLATATDLTELEGVPLSESGGFDTSADEDWFLIQPTGSNLVVFTRFDHSQGNIDIELFDENGIMIERSISETDDELITRAVTVGAPYYIRVFGETAGNPYDLVWNSYDADDSFEDNDTLATATDLRLSPYEIQEDLILLNEDWYQVELGAGDGLFVAEIYPFALIDRMVLELRDAGDVLVDSVATALGENRLELDTLAAGIYYLRVSGRNISGRNIGGKYALAWSSGNEDNYEENDKAADAFDLTANPATPLSAINGLGAQYDEDWFSVTLGADNSALSVEIDFTHNLGDLNLVLYDADENLIGSSTGTTDSESVSLTGLDAGVYYFQVTGTNLGNTYDLTWVTYAEDNYEDNDGFDESYALGNAPTGTLSLIDGPGVRGADDDYYALSIPSGYVSLTVNCLFAHADGDIALELFDGQQSSLVSSDSATDDETAFTTVNPTGGTIYIRVSGANETGAKYDLTWTFRKVDIYEDNDTIATATDISANEATLLSEVLGYATQTDVDYYLITLPANSHTLNVDVFFSHSLGNIDVNIYDAVPGLIASANSLTDNESLSTPVSLAGGNYYIEVTGADSGNYYDLIWSVDMDDPYEENDDATTSYDLSASDGVRLSAGLGLGYQHDEDWYSFTTPAGAISLSVLIDEFTDLEGNIDLELYDAADNPLASSVNGSDSEEIEIAVNPAGQFIKVRVFGEDKGNSYDLVWSSSTEDVYEDNDFVEDFYDMSDMEGIWFSDPIFGKGLATQADDDWYQIVVSTGATTLTVDCTFTHADGDIDLELYRLDPTADGEKTDPGLDQRKPTLVARVTSTDDNEQIVYPVPVPGAPGPGPEPGIYFIRVYFGNAGNVYDLRWEDTKLDDKGLIVPVVDPAGDSVFLSENWVFSEKVNTVRDARLLTPLANADGDAFPNWAEYAFDLDVELPDTVQVENSIQEIDGDRYFTISFIRNAEAVAMGYSFFVEESSNLLFSGQQAKLHSQEDIGNGLERVTYRCSKDITEMSQCFFRIRVEPPKSGY